MAKVKNKKRVSVEQIQKKRQQQNAKKSLNPFEVHINKEKMRVLGKKQKNEKGLPGVSRAKALQKRKHTLLNEYNLQNKSNKFVDKRMGERGQFPQEDKIMARFAAIKAKTHNKKARFNLADEEILTHRGQTLGEIERYDNPQSDDESEDEQKTGRLESDFVGDAHFGGGLLSNSDKKVAKTHKQLIEQLIANSKKLKAEKQKDKEATVDLTEKLDTEWKDLVALVNTEKDKKKDELPKPDLDDYDKVMKELMFEARGTVSNRLKTEDEIAKEEKEKLEKLEHERLQRMKGFNENNPVKPNHRSADDLDDDFVYESDTEDNMLSYDTEGQSNVQVRAEVNGKTLGDDDVEITEDPVVEESEEEQTDEDEEQSESEDSLADLKADEESSEDEITIVETETEKLEAQESKAEASPTESEQKELEKAGNELPFTFKLPDSYDIFLETLDNRSAVHQKVILERTIKCNHPSLSEGNKEGLGLLFRFTLQYINDLFTDVEDTKALKAHFNILSNLMPHIFELAQLNKENTHNSVMEAIKEKHQDYTKKKKKYPGLEVLVFFKLVSLLFSTSDFRHQVVTPCFMFMEQILRNCIPKSAQDVSYGLFICTLVLEFTSLSKRYLPAVVNYLAGVLHMCIPKTTVKLTKVRAPFKFTCSDLVLVKKYSKTPNIKCKVSYLLEKDFTEAFKVSALLLTLKLLDEFRKNSEHLSSSVEIFSEVNEYLTQIPMELYPQLVKDEYKQLCDSFNKLKAERKLHFLVMEEKKPKALRLYEPKIVEVYDGRRRKPQSTEKAVRDVLMHKLKKETKGALREIRRDKAFLGRVKINQRIKSDKERRDRVNKIYAEAASQQSELNALDRKNKRK